MDVNLTNREPICFGEVPCCDKLAIKEKPRSVRQDRTRGKVKPNRLFKPRIRGSKSFETLRCNHTEVLNAQGPFS